MNVAETMCPQEVQDFNNMNLCRNTGMRRIEDLSANLKDQLKNKARLRALKYWCHEHRAAVNFLWL